MAVTAGREPLAGTDEASVQHDCARHWDGMSPSSLVALEATAWRQRLGKGLWFLLDDWALHGKRQRAKDLAAGIDREAMPCGLGCKPHNHIHRHDAIQSNLAYIPASLLLAIPMCLPFVARLPEADIV
jgi:hypothetical protein